MYIPSYRYRLRQGWSYNVQPGISTTSLDRKGIEYHNHIGVAMAGRWYPRALSCYPSWWRARNLATPEVTRARDDRSVDCRYYSRFSPCTTGFHMTRVPELYRSSGVTSKYYHSHDNAAKYTFNRYSDLPKCMSLYRYHNSTPIRYSLYPRFQSRFYR